MLQMVKGAGFWNLCAWYGSGFPIQQLKASFFLPNPTRAKYRGPVFGSSMDLCLRDHWLARNDGMDPHNSL